uniref:glutamate synthase (ferredoxin) n=1 Tax=Chlamydomonas euryale TaxID=1486919 RepID=A0A7R9Z740_9CHLO|mmetsp:Transcript_5873/g.17998  ORF Transcript_5873/g.17998 Transcript_5873/m.17998 type:complete len:1620 (+) Transcript_5873:305-5164(+)
MRLTSALPGAKRHVASGAAAGAPAVAPSTGSLLRHARHPCATPTRVIGSPAAARPSLLPPRLRTVTVTHPSVCRAHAEVPPAAGLFDPSQDRDACGVGFMCELGRKATRACVDDALTMLVRMTHRGACGCEENTGDGAGILVAIPDSFLQSRVQAEEGVTLPPLGDYAVGQIFLPRDEGLRRKARTIIEKAVQKLGHDILTWRKVPTDNRRLGASAVRTEPVVEQLFISAHGSLKHLKPETQMYYLRKTMEHRLEESGISDDEAYVCSLSTATLVYKGQLTPEQVRHYFKDLQSEEFRTYMALVHSRFSTNTFPSWNRAQPMRMVGHNGEINTLRGNSNWMRAREGVMSAPNLGLDATQMRDLTPVIPAASSDSGALDSVIELLTRTGRDIPEVLMMMIPEAWQNDALMSQDKKDFYMYHSAIMEPWDGPALISFTDGRFIGATLDRNGLRPARFWRTSDDMIYIASEVGVLGDVISNAANVVSKGRLGPGQMVVADLEAGEFYTNDQISRMVATQKPYKEWVQSSVRRLGEVAEATFREEAVMEPAMMLRMQAASGMGLEDAQMVVESMAQTGVEPTYCMGDDIPLAVLSDKVHPLYDYFKQRFAQVTNPAIDPLREGMVMSIDMRLGARGNLLQPSGDAYKQVQLESPILLESELAGVAGDKTLGTKSFLAAFEVGKAGGLEAALRALCADVEAAVKAGAQCVVISDRFDSPKPELAPVPMLAAVGAVHHHLIKTGLRSDTSIIAETSTCYSTHHAAMLIGYGAHAICPYLAYETCRQWRLSSRTASLIKTGKLPDVSIKQAQRNFKKSIEKGILKILSKMGISLLSCYHGAQIFEAYGLGSDIVDMCFRGSVSRIGGMSLADLQSEAEELWAKAFPEKAMTKLEDYGFIQSRAKGEFHSNNQTMAKLLHKSIGLGDGSVASDEAYKAYMQHFAEAPAAVLRDCLELKSDKSPISIDEVEPAADIMARFCTGGMSLGAISRETHETIAIAVNRIGGKSNSGEGGEDPIRWSKLSDVDSNGKSSTVAYLKGLENGDIATSKIKQVASGRFGVSPQFLVNADQLEIKVAQGAKPGEGGQLPGPKVSPYIASLRRSKPGVPLISPPPHHDIYSIEDLAQLIYDLHQVNQAAKVSVKLVAEAGIGVIASGVAKANADVIQVSGHDGGTGASPISSIKHAGGPMEMGLAEAHQVLTANELRDRVVLRVDGGVRNGRDILMSAALGADEYGFGTAAMIATGCIMARVCHTNNCPVGVASQREELRARFPGTPGDLVNFFHHVAEEVRAGLADLGFKSLDELIGRADLLRQRDLRLAKTAGLDLSFLTTYAGATGKSSARIASPVHDDGPKLDDEILADPDVQAAIKNHGSVEKSYDIINVDRAAMGRIGGEIARHYGDLGFKGHLKLNLLGAAGQSFGCFMVHGMDVTLIGEANDYVGKGMAGGVIAIKPPADAGFKAESSSIVGNTCLYGATGGRLFVNGRAGERFAVRNSLSEAVVEGTGDHCCEYMTGGAVVCLGTVGRNVAAGMTGGLGYFLDEHGDFIDKVNPEIVSYQRVITDAGAAQLKELIEAHATRTGSAKAKAVLADWDAMLPKFWQLVPPAEKNTPEVNPDIAVQEPATAAA